MKLLNYKKISVFLIIFSTLLGACGKEPEYEKGSRILFSNAQGGDWEIFSMFPDGTGVSMLTWNGAYDWSASWSPTGKKIVYLSDYLKGETQVTRKETDEGIIFETIEVVDDRELYVMDPDGSNVKKLLDNNAFTEGGPDWSPEGSKIAFYSDLADNGNFDIYLMDNEGGDIKQLTDIGGISWDPSWSPDGQNIVFAHLADGTLDWQLYLVKPDTSELKPLGEGVYGWKPEWSPVDDRIVFAAKKNGAWGLKMTNSEGSFEEDLFFDGYNSYEPVWSDDGKQIAFGNDRYGEKEIFILDLETKELSATRQVGLPTDWSEIS